MSLDGKQFQIIDTMDLRCIIKNADGTTKTIFSGETSKAGLDAKADKVEIFSGIGQNKTFNMYTKKVMTMDVNIKAMDLEFLAYKNGVTLDKTTKNSFYVAKPITVATGTATISNVKRIMSIKTAEGEELKIVSVAPTDIHSVEVAIASNTATLTFYSSFVETTVYVTYEGDATTGKDNYTIMFYGNAFPKGVELLANTVVYDEDTQNIVGDVYVDIYSAIGDPEFSLAFEQGKPIEIETKFDIVVPRKLPDGTDNTQKTIGKMVITER